MILPAWNAAVAAWTDGDAAIDSLERAAEMLQLEIEHVDRGDALVRLEVIPTCIGGCEWSFDGCRLDAVGADDPRETARAIGLSMGLAPHGSPENVMHDPPGDLLFETQWQAVRGSVSELVLACL